MSETTRPVVFIPGENTPMSPHLQVWRFTVTMAASISHRATGVGNGLGMLLLVAWIGSAALSEEAFNTVQGILGSWFGLVILAGFTLSFTFHLVNGLRYLFMDSGKFISKEGGNRFSAFSYIAAPILTAAIFAAGFILSGGNA